MSHASWNVLAQIPAYMASVNNEQRRSKTESCELSRLGSSEATERLGLQRCASSDERRHGKFTVVLARTVNFIWVLEERRDNARIKFWHMSCSRAEMRERRHYGTD